MQEVLMLLGLIAVWLILVRVVLPRLGVPT
jgi:hypothetical protein